MLHACPMLTDEYFLVLISGKVIEIYVEQWHHYIRKKIGNSVWWSEGL